MRLVLLLVLLLSVGCTTRPPEALVACPVIDTTALRRCRLPDWLPSDGGEAVLVIWEALLHCVVAAEDAVTQIDGT